MTGKKAPKWNEAELAPAPEISEQEIDAAQAVEDATTEKPKPKVRTRYGLRVRDV